MSNYWKHVKPGVSRAEFKRRQALSQDTARYIHISAPLARGVNPITNVAFVRVLKRNRSLMPHPITNPAGSTYSVGRNKAKREARAQR